MNTTDLLSQDKGNLDDRIAHLEVLHLFEDLLMAQNAARVENHLLSDTAHASEPTGFSADAAVAQVCAGSYSRRP